MCSGISLLLVCLRQLFLLPCLLLSVPLVCSKLWLRTGSSVRQINQCCIHYSNIVFTGGILHPFTFTLGKEPIVAVLSSWLAVQVSPSLTYQLTHRHLFSTGCHFHPHPQPGRCHCHYVLPALLWRRQHCLPCTQICFCS